MSLNYSERALILAPTGRDAIIAERMFEEAELAAASINSVPQLVAQIEAGAGLVLVTEEALHTANLQQLSAALANQPAWSDLPIIVLTARGGIERNPQAGRLQEILGNVSFLERPFHPTTLISMSRTALRSRRRQYEARARIETIRQGEQQLQVALAAGNLGSWSLDVATRELTASVQCKAHYGYQANQPFTYQALLASIHRRDLPLVQRALDETLAGRCDYDVEYRCIWPGGSVHWVLVRGQLDQVSDSGGQRMVGVTLDITKPKQAEAALLRSEDRFRAAVDAVSGVLWTNDAEGRMFGEQPGWAAMTGQSFAEYQGFGWAASVHPDDQQPTIDAWNEAVAARRTFKFEHRVKQASGGWRNYAIRAIPNFEADGSLREWVGVHTDITEQRAAENALRGLAATLEQRVDTATAELRASEARVRALFETSFQYLVQLRPDGAVIDANEAALTGMEAQLGDVVGLPLWDSPWFARSPEVAGQLKAALASVVQGTDFRETFDVEMPTELRSFDFSLRPIYAKSGELAALVAEALDVTERKRAQEELIQTQKMETVGQLTGGVAHDFNNLLTPIVASLDMLHRRVEGDERAQKWAAAGLQSADRAKTLVNRLLAFARRQPLETKPVDVAVLVQNIRDLIERTIGPNIRFRFEARTPLTGAMVDANQLELALLNLCVNARDAMPDGGALTVFVDRRGAKFAGIELADQDYVVLGVQDTGSGMDAETIGRAIEPFYTTKQLGKGTGLGLSMVHGLAGQLGGGLTIASTVGHGTEICMWLPARALDSPAEPASIGNELTKSAGAADILLVEDEDLVRFAAAAILREAGYRVTEAASGEQALGLIDQGYAPDLLVSDQLMPGITGIQLAEQVSARLPATKVLIVTGYADLTEICFPLLSKPFTPVQLTQKVAGLL